MKAKPNILIIDDSESDTMLMEEAIKDTSIANNVYIVNDAHDALSFLRQEGQYQSSPRPNLMILDLKMPDMDGHEFLALVKNDDEFNDIPIIVLSTSSDPVDIKKCYKLHANCYIEKPVNFLKFRKVISVINDFWLGIANLPPEGG
ncbi:MAG: response regulator [Alphaproteobacteria bacterium]|nr:response regulator [Alphaproteobacteria bacterium]